jgi:chromosome partitioning protein
MKKTRVVAVALQAGGVGKTTVTLNLGALLVDRGRKVLLIDMDAQCNLTDGLDATYDSAKTVFPALVPETPEAEALPFADAVVNVPPRDGLFLLPGSPRMAYFDSAVSALDHREYRLREALKPIIGQYDFVLIDCPPGLGLVLLNALFAAQEVLVPVQTRQRRVNALPTFLKRLVQVQKHHSIEVTGIVPNQYDRRNAHDQQAYQYIQNFATKHGFRLFQPIATTTRISEADSRRMPLHDYDRSTPASEALEALAEAIDPHRAARAAG